MSKGEEAENVAIVFSSIYDINMVSNNNKLAYVALTRSKNRMYPIVVTKELTDYSFKENFRNIFLS